MVSTLGGAVVFVDHADEAVLSGPELVVGLGVGAIEHARLYAHLTGRACEFAEDLERLAAFPDAAVVVTTYAFVDERLLDQLYDRYPLTSAPGLIFSYDDADLSLQVLSRAAARHCSHRHFDHRRVDINTNIEFGAHMAPEFSIVGAQATPAEFRRALASGAGLLTLYSHSDGIDAYLRDGLVLCPMEGADLERPARAELRGHRLLPALQPADVGGARHRGPAPPAGRQGPRPRLLRVLGPLPVAAHVLPRLRAVAPIARRASPSARW
ncbi:hypothetical protein [Nannocystis pusilla]|uniref:hypothetical protein n=1 Tax=Nannocystis pusilla TaxID=889268 RepID=UPI003DA59CAC